MRTFFLDSHGPARVCRTQAVLSSTRLIATRLALPVVWIGVACGGVDDRDLAVSDAGTAGQSAGTGGASQGGVGGSEQTPNAAGSSVGGAGGAAGSGNPCAGLQLDRCECSVGEPSTCGAEYVSAGTCGARTLVCEAPGVWPPETACAPTSERCDPGQVDDDCDGAVDEGCSCINGATESCGLGIGGVRLCADGALGDCQCASDAALDIDANGVPDVQESLLGNGRFIENLVGWLQSQRDNTEVDGILFEHREEDAAGPACSGSMLLISTEDSGSNFADLCVPVGPGAFTAAAQAVLIYNAGSPRAGQLRTLSIDPSFVELGLTAFGALDCTGASLAEQNTQLDLRPDLVWQTLRTNLQAPTGTQALRVRINVVAHDPVTQLGFNTRGAIWDNVLLHQL
jgi:hypothetical protein